jgi:hypothetical protein
MLTESLADLPVECLSGILSFLVISGPPIVEEKSEWYTYHDYRWPFRVRIEMNL